MDQLSRANVFALADTAPTSVSAIRTTNVVALYWLLGRIPGKSEFESWSVYQARIDTRAQDFYALPVLTCTIEFSYNAENEEMTARLPTAYGAPAMDGIAAGCLSSTRGTYVGRTALGASRRVTVRQSDVYAIAAGRRGLSFTSVSWHMPPLMAAREKSFLYAVLAVRPAAANGSELVTEFSDRDEATIDDPIDLYTNTHLINVDYVAVWIVSNLTRQVLCRAVIYPSPENNYGTSPCSGPGDLSASTQTAAPPHPPTVEARIGSSTNSPSLTVLDRMELAREIARNYPPLLRDAGVSGEVVLRVGLTPDGVPNPSDVTVLSASHEAFVDAAKHVLLRLRLAPPAGGQAGHGVITIRFQPQAVP
jgi:TonB family protein